jgi:hypothetical protein
MMKQKTEATPPLLPDWAFVVQFRVGTNMEQDRMEGRVEHIVSGQATRFHSLEELLAFMAQILATTRA